MEAHDNLLEVCNEYIVSIKKPNTNEATSIPVESNSDMLSKIFEQPTPTGIPVSNQQTGENLFSDIDSFLTSDCFGQIPGRSNFDDKDGNLYLH